MLNVGSHFGPFQIESLLGRGSFGDVYRAFDCRNNRRVALKLLSQHLVASPEYRRKLAEEAVLAGRVNSPYVVKMWEHAEIDQQPYIAMEYISGPHLRELSPTLSFAQKVELGCKIGEGIEAAHGEGLLHRDLKPENIRIDSENQPRILDFGLAKSIEVDSVDEEGNIEGTLHYLSPELLSGELLSVQSDIFSFGTLLYELLVGQRPFEGQYAASIIYAILHEEPIPPCDINEALPVWVNTLMYKMLAKRPADRFARVSAAVAFMRGCLEGGAGSVTAEVTAPKQTVTVIDLKNLSGDSAWDYFCEGFTDDVISELSRRSDLIVAAEPSTTYRRNIRETFAKCRSDFVIVGSLMKLGKKIKLSLSVYGKQGDVLVWNQQYSEFEEHLFEMLSQAAGDAATALADQTNSRRLEVDSRLQADVSAYDYYLKGKSYYQTNKPEDMEFAIAMFRKAQQVDPDMALAHSGLSDVYAFQYMAYYDRSPQRISLAREEALKALERDPKSPDAHRSLARYYMFTNEPRRAEECLRAAVELNPKYALGYRTLAWLKEGQSDYKNAAEWATQALKLAPTDLETMLLLGLIHMNERKFTLAMATLQRAIELGPDYGRAYYNLGLVYLKLGVLDPALENFQLAIKYKGDPNCYIDCGYVYLAKKDYSSAMEQFRQSEASGFFPFVAEYYLGLTELARGKSEDSVPFFKRALELIQRFDLQQSENMKIMVYQALSLAGLRERENAYGVLNKIEPHDELDGEVLHNLARCYFLLGDAAKSQGALARALSAPDGPTEKEVALDPHFHVNVT